MLDLSIRPPQRFEFPSTLFNDAKSLVVLKLNGNIVLNAPRSFGFPSLKTLLLENVWYLLLCSFSTLFMCCPVLQNLYLRIVNRNSSVRTAIQSFRIIVPTLKILNLDINDRYCKLWIKAPALEYHYVRGYIVEHVLLGNLSNLVEANVGVYFDEKADYRNRIRDFIGALSNVKSLHLNAFITQVPPKKEEEKKKIFFFSCSVING